MKCIYVTAVLLLGALQTKAAIQAEVANPIEKVLSMISDLEAKIIKEGEVSQKNL